MSIGSRKVMLVPYSILLEEWTVSHSPGGSITSLLLRAEMEAPLQQAGCGPSPWHPEVKAVLQAITKTWISSVMTFMVDNCIDIHHNIMMEVYS
jgi:hypothetical protein